MSEFTADQKRVIDLRNRDILVSAAAGSGKTTVLVERIIKKITDEKDPVDIDRILVVTFTRAAAKEMRDKIRNAIDEALDKNPGDERLLRQASFVFHAQITTIDSFCNYLLKNYFHRVGAEPDFRIGDARELSILSKDVMDKMMEEYYATGDGDFKRLIDTYSVKNRDDAICDMILTLFYTAAAAPWPDEWLDSLLEDYIECESWDTKSGSDPGWLSEIVREACEGISEAKSMAESLLERILLEGPECPYLDAIRSDVAGLTLLSEYKTYDELYAGAYGFVFDRLSTKKYEEPYEGFKDGVKAVREEYKGIVNSILSDSLFETRESAKASMLMVGKNAKKLVELAKEYGHRFLEEKQKKGVLDFSDVEHLALDILVDRDTKKPTETALELRDYFEEILIDEYQDSNYLQETILRTISGEETGDNNYFMVGDVKQSIYAFRQARPEIFAGKYESFSKEDSKQQRIDLDKNFRSRRQVIDIVNEVFRPLMDKRTGGVEYDEAAELKFGAEYLSPVPGQDYGTELLLAQKDGEGFDEAIEDSADGDGTDFDCEGRMIAYRILKLMESFKVVDNKTGGHRPLKYSDIVILLRGVKGRGTKLMETLMSFGMPAHVTDDTGYFDTTEVKAVLSLLSVLDNPRQDIPLAAVMLSPFFGYTNEMLAKIKAASPEEPFYKAVFSYEGDGLHESFLKFLDRYRKKLNDTPIHVLLQEIFAETGYVDHVRALPGGENRAANLERLIDLAVDFEKTSFRGCFKFVNYIRQLKKYNQDVGTADLIGEDDDAIRIMTIHKSKGLEFPVVFLAGINKRFNMSDASGTMVLSPGHGLALQNIEADRRIRSKYLYRSHLSSRIISDMLGEEMRVLYVAMTRAKEKLIITGTYKDDEELLKYGNKKITHEMRQHFRCYADFLYPTLFDKDHVGCVKKYDTKKLVFIETKSELERQITGEDIEELIGVCDDTLAASYDRYGGFTYPKPKISFKAKYSVSELKHRSMEAVFDSDAEVMVEKPQKGVSDGALRGTVMHLFMEHFDFTKITGDDIIEKQIAKMIDDGHMTPEQAGLLDKKSLKVFLSGSLCQRMSAAAGLSLLFREKPFVMGDDPEALLGEYYPEEKLPSGEEAPMLLVQGIIDAFFVEGDEIILVDYKSDRVGSSGELVKRYKKQMELYADALERGFSKKVKEKIIYSFVLSEEIII